MNGSGSVGPAGDLGVEVIRAGDIRRAFPDLLAWPHRAASVLDVLDHGTPQSGLPKAVNHWRLRNARHLWRGVRRVGVARALRLPHFYGQLWLSVVRADGEVLDLGLASMRVVTTAGVNFIVDAFQNTTEVETFKYHGLGTGAGAEAVGDTALATELTTQYAVDSTRPTGTTTEGASANVYRSVATNTVDGSAAVTEHGIFSAASAGTLLDRSLFSVVNLSSGDSLVTTYDLTVAAGG